MFSLSLPSVLLFAAAVGAAPPAPVDVFTAGDAGVASFRIPSLVRTRSGALVALAEARTGGDCAAKSVVSRRSADGGATWGPPSVVFSGGGEKGGSAGNPTAVFDAVSGRVVVALALGNATACNPGQSMWVVDDGGSDGVSWGAPRDISEQVGASWAGALPGPGTMAQLPATSRWPGRLIFPAHRGAYGADAVMYSDDHGASWAVSAAVLDKMDEAAIAVASPNGSLLLNMRNDHLTPCDCRATARSEDGGATWSAIAFDSTLIEPVCQGSLVRLAGALFFSNPATKTKRLNITVRRSDDGGSTWLPNSFVAFGQPSAGYSCIAAGDAVADIDGALFGGILYEAVNGGGAATITFRLFPLDLQS